MGELVSSHFYLLKESHSQKEWFIFSNSLFPTFTSSTTPGASRQRGGTPGRGRTPHGRAGSGRGAQEAKTRWGERGGAAGWGCHQAGPVVSQGSGDSRDRPEDHRLRITFLPVGHGLPVAG